MTRSTNHPFRLPASSGLLLVMNSSRPVVGDQAAGTYQGLRTEGMTALCLLIGRQEGLWIRCHRT